MKALLRGKSYFLPIIVGPYFIHGQNYVPLMYQVSQSQFFLPFHIAALRITLPFISERVYYLINRYFVVSHVDLAFEPQ